MNSIKKSVIIVSIFLFLGLLFFPLITSAFEGEVESYTLLSPLPGMGDDGKTVTSLGGYLTNIFEIIIGLAAVLAVLMLVFAGIQYMTAEAVGQKSDAKERINNTLFGLLLVFGSWYDLVCFVILFLFMLDETGRYLKNVGCGCVVWLN